MRDIHFTSTELGNFADIFSRPFTVQEYDTAPELVAMRHIAPPEPLAATVPFYILGKEPATEYYTFPHSSVPEMYIAELRNVFLFKMVAHSQTGNFFKDCARMYQPGPPEQFYRFSVADPMQPLVEHIQPMNLGNGYFCHTSFPDDSEPTVFNECAMPFFTSNHFGHFLIECIPQLWLLEHGFKPRLILPPFMRPVPDYLLEMVAPFGMGEADFIFSGQCAVFSQLVLPSRAYMHYYYISQKAKNVYNRIRDYYFQNGSACPDKIYISREKVQRRRLINEAQCKELFERYGFTTIFSEDLDMCKKIEIFANASYIAGPVSSGFHNVLFSRKPSEVSLLHLTPREFPSVAAFFCIERSFGRKPNFVYGDFIPEFSHLDRWNAPWTMDLENLEVAINQWLSQ